MRRRSTRPRALAAAIRREIFEETALTVSAGVATGKMIAKIASDSCKPDGLLAIPPGEEAAFLAPLPVARLWGIGPKTQARLTVVGISTIGELAALDEHRLRALFGSWWHDVRDLACGVDRRRVETERETKSISTEETFEYDVRDESRLVEVLRAQAIELAEILERERTVAQTIGVKIRRGDFTDRRPSNTPCRADPRSAADLSRCRPLPAPSRAGRFAGASARDARRLANRGRRPPGQPLLTPPLTLIL